MKALKKLREHIALKLITPQVVAAYIDKTRGPYRWTPEQKRKIQAEAQRARGEARATEIGQLREQLERDLRYHTHILCKILQSIYYATAALIALTAIVIYGVFA